MADDIKVVEGGSNPNPSGGGGQPTTQVVTPQKEDVKPVNPQPEYEVRLKELTSKLETLTNQYNGSTAEALRLKDENEKLKKNLEEASRQPSKLGETFQKLMEEKGLQFAIDHLVNEKLASIESKVDGIFAKESSKIYETFKASHKGLDNVQVLEKFEKEFAALKNVYSDMNEALEKAYLLAGGKEAEVTPTEAPKAEVKQESDKIIKSVVGGDADKRPAPVTTTQLSAADIQQRINDLEFQAANLDRQGRDTTHLWVEVDKLKSQLAGKV